MSSHPSIGIPVTTNVWTVKKDTQIEDINNFSVFVRTKYPIYYELLRVANMLDVLEPSETIHTFFISNNIKQSTFDMSFLDLRDHLSQNIFNGALTKERFSEYSSKSSFLTIDGLNVGVGQDGKLYPSFFGTPITKWGSEVFQKRFLIHELKYL